MCRRGQKPLCTARSYTLTKRKAEEHGQKLHRRIFRMALKPRNNGRERSAAQGDLHAVRQLR